MSVALDSAHAPFIDDDLREAWKAAGGAVTAALWALGGRGAVLPALPERHTATKPWSSGRFCPVR